MFLLVSKTRFNKKPARNYIVRDNPVLKKIIHPNFLHLLYSNFTTVNKGSSQHFKEPMFTHSPSRQNVNSRLWALAFTEDSIAMLVRSRAAHHPNVICVCRCRIECTSSYD